MDDVTDPNADTGRPHDNDQHLKGIAHESLAEMDQEVFTNMRTWLRKTVEDAGAECTGSGVGFGSLDLDIELEGFRFCITMKPIGNRRA